MILINDEEEGKLVLKNKAIGSQDVGKREEVCLGRKIGHRCHGRD